MSKEERSQVLSVVNQRGQLSLADPIIPVQGGDASYPLPILHHQLCLCRVQSTRLRALDEKNGADVKRDTAYITS
jgi:hypothetical protein